MQLFVVCWAVGFLIIIPVNATGDNDQVRPLQSLDAPLTRAQLGVINGWTLSNIKNGSGALWVHFFAAYALSFTAFKLLLNLFSDVCCRLCII